MDHPIKGFSPHLGLEQIDRYDGQAQGLPAQREAQLTGEPVRQRVQDLFDPQSLDQTLRRFIATHAEDPAIRTPARFTALVQDCANELRTLAEAEHHPVLQQASALLSHDQQLRDLLAHYRSALTQA